VNYIKELNAFRDWAMINRPSTGQVALWYSLMSINNMTGWNTWFTVPNQTLQLMTGLSRQGLDKARNGLIQHGLIQYKKGRSNQAGSYRMISFFEETECQKVGTEVGTAAAQQLTQGEAQEGRAGCHTGSTLYKQKLNKNETKKQINSGSSSSKLSEQVKEVWDHYLATFGNLFPRGLTLTKDRRTKIEARLKEGCTVDEIKEAITNIRKSPFHCGDNDRGKIYADITFICRNRGKVEEWMNYQPDKVTPLRRQPQTQHPLIPPGYNMPSLEDLERQRQVEAEMEAIRQERLRRRREMNGA